MDTAVGAIVHSSKADLDVDHLETLTGMGAAADDLGTFTGSTITDNSTIKTALQELETEVEDKANSTDTDVIDDKADDLVTLSGVSVNSTDLGTFTGSTITDNSTIKTALQELETEVEDKQDTLTGLTSTVTELNILDGATVTTTELNYVDGVTSAIQTQIDGKQASATDLTTLSSMQTGGATALAALTSTEIAILDGATVTTTELNYVDGVTSAIQTQIDGKVSAAVKVLV